MSLIERLDDRSRDVLRVCVTTAKLTKAEVHLVGGPVRDLLRGVRAGDLDLAIEGDAAAFASALAHRLSARLVANERFLTWRLTIASRHHIDLAAVRTETYARPGALPDVRQARSIVDDLARRDFTVNAMALRLADGELIDPFDGAADLSAKLLRTLHDRSFVDDPTRVFRALRLAHRRRLSLEPRTEAQLDEAVRNGALDTVSKERLWKEVELACVEDEPVAVLRALTERGCLAPLLGNVRSESLADLPDRIEFPERIDARVVLLGALTRGCDSIAFEAMPWDQDSVSAIRAIASRRPRLSDSLRDRDHPLDRYDALASASDEERFLAVLEQPDLGELIERYDQSLAVARSIRGDELGVEPGPWIGQALRETQRRIFAGEVEESGAPAFASRLAMKYLEKRAHPK